MLADQRKSRSMTKQFRHDYLMVSIIPLSILLILVIAGISITRDHLADMIVQSTYELNMDAEHNLQALGENIIRMKARDVAKQIEIYFRMHPDADIKEMRKDPLFMELALQKVGKTGYTALTETKTYLFRAHPNRALWDQDLRGLAKDRPSWWKIVEAAASGDEISGHYDWIEPDGSVRKKFMTVSPVRVMLNGKTIMVAATTYIDEFSAPTVTMQNKASRIVQNYQNYVFRQGAIFVIISAGVILLTFSGTYLLGHRAANRYMLPIMQLADSVREFGEGHWDFIGQTKVLERTDEIGILARALCRMSSQLKDIFSRLEQRVAQLKETQEALAQSEDHFRTHYEESKRTQEVYQSLIHSSADAIVIYDLEGRVKYLSPMFTTIFGWTAEELSGKQIPFLPESERATTLAAIKDVIENGNPCQGFETKRITKSGSLIDVSMSSSRYDDHQGRPAGMLVILRDISDRKRMENHLQHIERMEAIGTLAGGVAHDFNNLLMVIQGSITLLKHGMEPAHPYFKDLSNIERQVQRGAKLTSQLLGYARKGKYEVKPINLNEILRECAETFRRTRKDISVHYDLAPALNCIEADIYQIEQTLMNLFINASDAMSEGGDLFLSTANIPPEDMAHRVYAPKPGSYVMLSIRDSGVGMDQKTLDRIFEPFFTTKEMGRGTGLGLASVYGIVQGHGGHIDVHSELGRGTVFTIYLPASDRHIPAIQKEPGQTAAGTGTILLIDDEALVLEVGVKMLEALGYTVLAAETGRKALALFQAHHERIDLVMLDMIMPDISGSQAFDMIKAISPGVAVLLSSGYSIDGKATDILNRGCNGFIQKPYSMQELSEKLRRIMKTA